MVGLRLWDVVSDDHDVVAADGPVAEIGSSRGACAFLDFPELGLVEFAPADDSRESGEESSVSQAAVVELDAQKLRAEVERFRAELCPASAREEAMDRLPPPATLRAYRQVYGRDRRDCPPV